MLQDVLEGMPDPGVLRLHTSDGQVLVTCGRSVLYRYDADDTGMRNLAIVALTDEDRRVDEVAGVFGLTATYVSMLRGRARAQGSAGLVRRRGRPPKLSARQVAKARTWAGQGWTQQAIADRLGVARSVISELLARVGPAPVQQVLPEPEQAAPQAEPVVPEPEQAAPQAEPEQAAPQAEPVVPEPEQAAPQAEPVVPEPEQAASQAEPEQAEPVAVFTGSSRITTGTFGCRYAGAMLLHGYLDRVGAQGIFATVAGGPARRYDDLAVLSAVTLGFALGIDTIEGAKHLARDQAGPAVGLRAVPELKTLRTPAVRVGRRVRPVGHSTGLRRRDAGRGPGRGSGVLRR